MKPVYAAIHFPGTSMLYAPLLLLGVGPAVFTCLVAGAIVGMTCRVVTELVDGVAGALVVPLLIAVAQLRLLSTTLVSHHVVLLPVLLAVWAFLHWRRRPGGDLRWALAIGACLGFAAITRPLEALAYAVAIAAAAAWSLRGSPSRRWLSTAALVVAATLPFVALQLAFDRSVSGDWLLPPYERYNQVFHPGIGYNAEASGGAASIPTNLPQKIDYYNDFIAGSMRRAALHEPLVVLVTQRIPTLLAVLAPSPLLLAFWVPAMLGLFRRDRAIFAAAAGVYLLLCLPYAIFFTHYALAAAPLAALLTVLGVHVVGRGFGGGRRSTEVLAAGCVFALSVVAIPVLNPKIRDSDYPAPITLYVNTRLAAEVTQPALVLSRYRTWDEPFDPRLDNPNDEPVYTIDALWPEQSPIARLQDLGPERNREAYAFFAARDPARNVYLLDRRSRRLTPLGTVAELLAKGEPPAYFPAASR